MSAALKRRLNFETVPPIADAKQEIALVRSRARTVLSESGTAAEVDARLLDILMQMGLDITVTQLDEIRGELVGSLQIQGGKLKGITLAGADSAALIDEIPVLAAIAPFTEKGMEVHDARELRVKESDRIATVASNLRRMGAQVEEREDGLKIRGGQSLRGAEVDSHSDHRIAMAFAVAALRAEGETQILGAESAAISYPAFFETLEALAERS